MKVSIVGILPSFFSLPLSAQVIISGQVLEADGTTPVAYATVSALSTDSTLLGRTLTKDDGSFTLQLRTRGRALVNVSYIGYAPTSRELHIGANKDIYSIGKIILVPNAQTLEQVTVTGNRATLSGALDKKNVRPFRPKSAGRRLRPRRNEGVARRDGHPG